MFGREETSSVKPLNETTCSDVALPLLRGAGNAGSNEGSEHAGLSQDDMTLIVLRASLDEVVLIDAKP